MSQQNGSTDTQKSDVLNIAFLEADQPSDSVQKSLGGYDDILHDLLDPILAEMSDTVTLETKGYDVVKREYPTFEELQHVDCIVVSGSFVADACEDVPWVLKLAGFLLLVADSMPRIRIIAICFGHQIVSRAFSGQKIEPNPAGWEVGATELTLTDLGEEVLAGTGSVPDKRHKMVIQQIHQDHVTNVPDGFELLASSEKCRVQSLVRFYPDGKDGPPYTHSKRQASQRPWSASTS